MRAKLLMLLLGLLLGLGAAVLLPSLRQQLTPSVLRQAPTEGVVDDKRSEADRLLLTLVTTEGAVLATFTEQVAEIDLLVAPGDTVSLALDGYRPFVVNPEIERVVKSPPAPEPAAPPADSGPAESPGGETPEPGEPESGSEASEQDEPGSAAEPAARPVDRDAPAEPGG